MYFGDELHEASLALGLRCLADVTRVPSAFSVS